MAIESRSSSAAVNPSSSGHAIGTCDLEPTPHEAGEDRGEEKVHVHLLPQLYLPRSRLLSTNQHYIINTTSKSRVPCRTHKSTS